MISAIMADNSASSHTVKARKPELTAASVFLMFAVIFIHCASEGVTNYLRDSLQFASLLSLHRLASFAVQGFIFLSGVKLFLGGSGTFSYKRFYFGRIKRVVLPYAAVFTLFYVYFLLAGTLEFSPSYYFMNLLTGGMVGHLYFVAIICQFYLLMPLWRFLADKVRVWILLPVSLFIMLACRDNLPRIIEALTGAEFAYNSRLFTTYLFYFVSGICVGRNYDRFINILKRLRISLFVSFIIVGAADCAVIWSIYTGRAYPIWADSFHALYCSLAIPSLMLVSLVVTKRNTDSILLKLILPLDKISYNVYLIHPLVIFILDKIMRISGILSISLRFILRFPLTCAISIAGCLITEKLTVIFSHRIGR